MGLTRDNSYLEQRQLRDATIRDLKDKVNLHPLGRHTVGTGIDVFAVHNPHKNEYKLSWADPAKLEQKIARGAEIVTPEDARKLYKIPAYEIRAGFVSRRGVVLMRTPIRAYEARMAANDLATLSRLDNLDSEYFNDKDSAAVEVTDEGVVRRRGTRGKNWGIRPESPTIEDALAVARQRMEEAGIRAEAAAFAINRKTPQELAESILADMEARPDPPADPETPVDAAGNPVPATSLDTDPAVLDAAKAAGVPITPATPAPNTPGQASFGTNLAPRRNPGTGKTEKAS